MHIRTWVLAGAVLAAATAGAAPALAQGAPAVLQAQPPPASADSDGGPTGPCGEPMKDGRPNLPPTNLPPILRCIEIKAHPVNETLVDHQTYLYYIKSPYALPSQDKWPAYDEHLLQADFTALLNTNFLENLWIEVYDEPFANGAAAKHVVFNIEEKARVKAVNYIGSDGDKLKVEMSKIDDKLREGNVELRLDSFLDESTIRKVKGVIRDLYADLGYNSAVITTKTEPLPGAETNKLIRVTFVVDAGPMVRVAAIDFDGNKAFDDSTLRGQLHDNKPKSWLSFLTDSGIYHEAKFSDDADRLAEFYKSNGYAAIQIGAPVTEVLETSEDGQTQWIRLRIPVQEGHLYHVGKFEIGGTPALKPEAILSVFKIQSGDVFDIKKLRKGFEKVKEAYGAYGYWQWQPDPDITFRDVDMQTAKPIPGQPPIADIVIKMNEGKQFFVNRITFVGNTNTHDAVIRRELRVAEGGIFNSEALKDSVRRINQLGYFKPLEPEKEGQLDVVPTPNSDNKVDVKVKVEEQNRNQLSFGAGVSQFEGVFGQLSFQTANFMGRGETASISLQKGSQARQYQLAFTEPYLFDRPISVGIDGQATEFIYPAQFTQDTRGGGATIGFPLANYTRMFLGYSFQDIRVFDINSLYITPDVLKASPYLRDSLLVDQNGERRVGKISPMIVFNTVNQPLFPSNGTRLSAAFDFAGVGGNAQYISTNLEGIWYVPLTQRMSFGLHLQGQYIRPYGTTTTLPIFEKLFSGGEYTIRGYDIRTISPRDPLTGTLVGGNKLVTLNYEYYINLFSQARLVFFYDAGEVKDVGQPLSWKEPVFGTISPGIPFLSDPTVTPNFLTPVGAIHSVVLGTTTAVRMSAGVEVRFLMPVLNVPFRLISSYNPNRFGVLNNSGVQTPRFTFRFAVGTTF